MSFLTKQQINESQKLRDSQFEGLRDIVDGYIINKDGSIEGDREGYVWFQAQEPNSQPRQVFFDGNIADIRAGMRTQIERDPKEPARWKVKSVNRAYYFDQTEVYETLPSRTEVPNKAEYEWPPGYPGSLALNISPRQINQFAVRPTSPESMKVRAYSGFYATEAGTYAYFQGPKNTEDFTARVPGTAGLARLVSISVDTSGDFVYVNGDTFVNGLPIPVSAYPAAETRYTLISSVKLVNGMTAIEEANFINEMRPVIASASAAGTAKVYRVWESDFGAVALQSDADGDIGIGTSTPIARLHTVIGEGTMPSLTGDGAVIQNNSIASDDVNLWLVAGASGESNLNFGDSADEDVGQITYLHGNNDMFFTVNGAQHVVIDGGGFVGINNLVPDVRLESLDASGAQLRLTYEAGVKFADFTVDTSHDLTIKTSSNGQIKLQPTTDSVDFFQVLDADGGTPILNVDSTNEQTLFNTSTRLLGAFGAGNLQVDKASNGTFLLHRESADTGGGTFEFLKRRSVWGVISDGDRLGTIGFSGADSVDAANAAQIWAEVDGTPGANDMPGALVFATSPDGSASVSERMRIDNAGLVGIGTSSLGAKLSIDQSSATAAIPTLSLDQADLSEEFVDFITTVGAGNPIDTAAIGTYYGKARVAVNGTFKYVALYNS